MQLTVLPLSDRQTSRQAPNLIALESAQELITELQSLGMQLEDPAVGAASRKGGAGPSDHKAVVIDGRTIMVPVHTHGAGCSPYLARERNQRMMLERDGLPVAWIAFPPQPRFYGLETADGIPYWKIAVLHGSDVLATTVLQNCIRYQNRATACQFCGIGQSLKAGRTIARKTPEQLAEVAQAAVRLDGVRHMVLTTGTPNLTDRGADVLCLSAAAIKAAVDLPIQGQCEPPDDFAWFDRMRQAGIDALGMHLEAVEPHVRRQIMPGKAQISVERYLEAFEAAVGIFGFGQVSTYILAGLGDSPEAIIEMSRTLIGLGVYPFVVPFVPISGTPLEHHAPPPADFMQGLLAEVARLLADAGMRSADIKAGCGKCGACSSLASYERPKEPTLT